MQMLYFVEKFIFLSMQFLGRSSNFSATLDFKKSLIENTVKAFSQVHYLVREQYVCVGKNTSGISRVRSGTYLYSLHV